MHLPHLTPRYPFNALQMPAVRLGVTGLSRAGKTVFICALVRQLLTGGRLPFFSAACEGRIASVHLEPQPDDQVPRFDFETHVARLTETPPTWPESTRQISQLRLVVTYHSDERWKRLVGRQSLAIDIIDYPGEWLLDLALLDETYEAWSRRALAALRATPAAKETEAFLRFISALSGAGETDEQLAITGAGLFTAHLLATRKSTHGIATQGPGRFLLPGDLAGSPLLTFFPLEGALARPSLHTMLERRYGSYRSHVVQPFFRNHFSRLNRQIVLVDVLSAINQGSAAIHELEEALTLALKAFRPGAYSWLGHLFKPSIDKVLFAATKADHLHHTSHDRLEAILRLLTERAAGRAEGAGAEMSTLAIAALRSTREAEVREGNENLHCIAGVPLPGETIDGQVFDGTREAVIFPGDLPLDPKIALDRSGSWHREGRAAFVKFRPPRLAQKQDFGEVPQLPHIRLDRAIEFLIGDWLK